MGKFVSSSLEILPRRPRRLRRGFPSTTLIQKPKDNVEYFVESQSFILPQVLMRSCKRDRLDPDTVRGLFVRAHRAPVINQPIDAVLHRGGARVHESLQPS